MKVCSNCGKEFMESENICPHCASVTAIEAQSIAPQLRSLQKQVKNYYITAILSIVFSVLFSVCALFVFIHNFITRRHIKKTVLFPTIPAEIEEYETIQKLFKKSQTISFIGFVIFSILFLVTALLPVLLNL